MDKQEQLQKLMDNIMSENCQIYEQMEELMQEMDPENAGQLNEMELNLTPWKKS